MVQNLTYMSIYDTWFKLKNRDPLNYVNNKDLLFYGVLAVHVFFIWFIASIFDNYDYLDTYNDIGKTVVILNNIVIASIGLLILIWLFNKNNNQIYSLLGIMFILYLVSMFLVIFNFDKGEIDSEFHKDPVAIAYSFLLIYSFVNYFIC